MVESATEQASSVEASRRSSAAESPDLLSDCQIMLRFALKEGLPMPDDLRRDIAELDRGLVRIQLSPISAIPEALLDVQGSSSEPTTVPSDLLLKVQGALSRLIAPATALTLQVSEPPPGRRRFLGGLPVLVKIAAWVALGCAVGFVGTSIPAAQEKVKKVAESANPTPTPTPAPSPTPTPSSASTVNAGITLTPTPTPTPSPPATAAPTPTPTPSPPATAAPATAASATPASQSRVEPSAESSWLGILRKAIGILRKTIKTLLPSLNAAFGAGLGAAFYILLSTQPYLTNRSFDPKYNAIYACRFITGLIGGIILSIALGPIIASKIEGGPFPITPGILAILGGYAAEAVQQILQRLVEVLLTAVRGDGSAQAQARTVLAQTQQSSRLQKMLLEYEREADQKKKQAVLDQIHQLLASPPAAS